MFNLNISYKVIRKLNFVLHILTSGLFFENLTSIDVNLLQFIFVRGKEKTKLIYSEAIFRVSVEPACMPQHKVEPGERQLRNLL